MGYFSYAPHHLFGQAFFDPLVRSAAVTNGGGIGASNAGAVSILYNSLTRNVGYDGWALFLDSSNGARISYNTISGHQPDNAFGTVTIKYSDNVTAEYNTFTGNSGGYHGWLFDGCDNPVFRYNEVSGNGTFTGAVQVVSGSGFQGNHNNIYNMPEAAYLVYATTTNTVDFTNCYWGTTSPGSRLLNDGSGSISYSSPLSDPELNAGAPQ